MNPLQPPPTPGQVRAARLAAGHTQTQAAVLVGLRRWQTWAEYEAGKPMPALTWSMYLLATGQHPEAQLLPRAA